LAIKPNDGETFLREVDDELRRERLNQTVTRYGWWIVAGAVLVLAAIGGIFWYRGYQASQAEARGESLLNALDSLESGNRNGAITQIDALAESGSEGYRAAALFARANAQIGANNVNGAVATLGAIAADESLEEPYRQAALVRQTQLQFDQLQPPQIIQRLSALARPGQPFFGAAGEMVGVAQLRMNRPDLAGPLFARIGRDETVPPSIRTRAIQIAGSLGVNALPEPPVQPVPVQTGAPPAPRPPAGAAAPSNAAQPAPAAQGNTQ
jgi:hypothetical protein